jgi:hypothetical protein
MTDTDLDAVRLAVAHYRHEGLRQQAVRDRFGLSVTGFYALVNRLVDDPAVEAALPVECHRLQRVRAADVRSGRRLSTALPAGAPAVVASSG